MQSLIVRLSSRSSQVNLLFMQDQIGKHINDFELHSEKDSYVAISAGGDRVEAEVKSFIFIMI